MKQTKFKYVLISCPLCKGSGRIKRRCGVSGSYTLEQVFQARKLFRQGIALRDIAKKMGINHPQTIFNLIHRKSV